MDNTARCTITGGGRRPVSREKKNNLKPQQKLKGGDCKVVQFIQTAWEQRKEEEGNPTSEPPRGSKVATDLLGTQREVCETL